jgi:alanyl-tRNA synthetase
VPAGAVDESLRNLSAELQVAHRENTRLRTALALHEVTDLARHAQQVEDVAVVAAEISGADGQVLRDMSDRLREMLGSAVVVLASVVDGKPQVIAAVTDDLVGRGLHAGGLVKGVAKIVGGGGGGKSTLAQAGGRDPERLPEALAAVPDLVRGQLAGA